MSSSSRGSQRTMAHRGLVFGLVGVLLSSALALLALEGLGRLVHEPRPLRRVWDPFAYRIPHPGLVDTVIGSDGRRVTVFWNELGMRGPFAAETAPGIPTLVFLGGSTTENYALERSETFPELVGSTVGGGLGRPVTVFNAGMSAGTSSTSFGRLQHQILDLEPSLVVVLHGINDLVGGFHAGFRTDGRHLPRPPAMDWRPRSYLVDWIRSRRRPRPLPRPSHPSEELHVVDYADFPARRVFERNLRSMAAVAQAHDVALLFLTQPTLYRKGLDEGRTDGFRMASSLVEAGMTPPDVESLAAGMEAFNDTIRLVAERSGAFLFDLDRDMPRDWTLFTDECHFSRSGNAAVAERIAPKVLQILASGGEP